MKRLTIALGLLVCTIAFAQNWNTWQVTQPFNRNSLSSNGEALPTPGFQADLTSSITPQIGTAGTFSRATARNYWSAPGTLSQVTANNPAIPAFQPDMAGVSGLAMYSGTKNWNLQSEAPATTWTEVGAPDVTNGVGTWFGSVAYGSIQGVLGEGITQTVGLTAVDKTIMLSAWMQADTSPITVRFTIEGDSGGTPETLTQDVIVTANEPARYYAPAKLFTGAATGDVKVSITLRGTGKIFIGGIQTERKETDSTEDQFLRIPGPYVKTTVAAVAHDADILTYPASNISNVAQFSFSVWVNSDWRNFGNVTPYRDHSPGVQDKYIIGIRDAGNNVILELRSASGSNFISIGLNGATVDTLFERHYGRRWYHYVVTIDYTNDVYKLYRNGVLEATDTTAFATPGAADTFYIGSPNAYRQWNGIINYLKYYPGELLDANEVRRLFYSELNNHIETTYKDGWPLGPNWHDPYTRVFFDFSESSGSIVDEIGVNTLTVNGAPTFSAPFTGRFADLSPGITYGTGKAHRKTTAITALNHDLSTTNITVEMYVQKDSTVGEQNLVTGLGHGSNTDYGWRIYFSNDTTLKLDLQADDGTTKSISYTLASSLVDGEPHKIRLRWGLNTAARLWIDEYLYSTSGDDDAGTVFTNQGLRIGEKYDGSGSNFIGSFLSLRISMAASDASQVMTSSGGPLILGAD